MKHYNDYETTNSYIPSTVNDFYNRIKDRRVDMDEVNRYWEEQRNHENQNAIKKTGKRTGPA